MARRCWLLEAKPILWVCCCTFAWKKKKNWSSCCTRFLSRWAAPSAARSPVWKAIMLLGPVLICTSISTGLTTAALGGRLHGLVPLENKKPQNKIRPTMRHGNVSWRKKKKREKILMPFRCHFDSKCFKTCWKVTLKFRLLVPMQEEI